MTNSNACHFVFAQDIVIIKRLATEELQTPLLPVALTYRRGQHGKFNSFRFRWQEYSI